MRSAGRCSAWFGALPWWVSCSTSVVCYIAMGWVIVIAIRPLLEKMDALCLWLLVVGGVFYTVGVIFYAIKKVRYFHSVWHIFVLMGSLCHYLSILFAILP